MKRIQTLDGIYEVYPCIKCGVEIVLDAEYVRRRREDHTLFHCPNGHAQHFTGKSETEQLRAQLDTAKKAREVAERQRLEGALGKCPHCARTYRDIVGHMQRRHGVSRVELSDAR